MMKSLLIRLLCASALLTACTRTQAKGDEVLGIPSDALDTTAIADEVGSGPPALALMPLEVGNTWTYEVDGADNGCSYGKHTQKVLRQEQVGGRTAFALTDFCGRQEEVRFSTSGNQILQYENAGWRTGLASPLVEDRSWDLTRDVRYRWHKIGWEQVQAGLFADCWERQAEDDNTFSQVFCDGAGLVSVSGPNLRIELTAFSLNRGQLRSRDN
jgi:hypothetical protein